VGEICYRRLIVMEFRLAQAVRTFPADPGLSLGLLEASDLDDYLAFQPEARREQIAARWAAGHRCFSASIDGRPAGVTWCALDRAWSDYLGVSIPLAPGEALGYGTYTHPDFRGRGVAAAIRSRLLETLKQEELGRCLAMVMPENRGGMAVAEKLGYRPVGVVAAVWLGRRRRRIVRMRPGEPALGALPPQHP
jgi:RimJ/RimL family protein N-acetyltransferase